MLSSSDLHSSHPRHCALICFLTGEKVVTKRIVSTMWQFFDNLVSIALYNEVLFPARGYASRGYVIGVGVHCM